MSINGHVDLILVTTATIQKTWIIGWLSQVNLITLNHVYFSFPEGHNEQNHLRPGAKIVKKYRFIEDASWKTGEREWSV